MRIGLGFDVHAFEKNREFRLGGVLIDHYQGLAGHSDADVLIHSICDALLGAVNLGDIGSNFPDSDQKYKDIRSTVLLKAVAEKYKNIGYKIVNIDSVVVLQKPKIAPYIPQMKEEIAKCLDIDVNQISIKATTTEHLGFEGREEGVSAQAVVLVEKEFV